MTNSPPFPPYRSHLLRMWVESTGRRSPVWRFSLEDVATGNRCGFADLDALLVHLLALMEPATPADLHTPSPPQPHACHTLED